MGSVDTKIVGNLFKTKEKSEITLKSIQELTQDAWFFKAAPVDIRYLEGLATRLDAYIGMLVKNYKERE